MDLYCTTKNTGPSWGQDPLYMMYLGTSIEEARDAVEESFRRCEVTRDKFPTQYPNIWSAIPAKMDREFVAFYSADGWWYSIVKFSV